MWGKPEAPDEYADYLVMKTMGWDWHTYLRQPDWLIEMTIGFLNAEGKAQEKAAKKAERSTKI